MMESSLTEKPEPTPIPRWSSLQTVFLTTVVMWCAIPLSPNAVDSDFWGHVKYGQDTISHGLDRTATYTFTARNHRWINHENLSELIFALGVDHLGVQSLLILKGLLGLMCLMLMIWNARKLQVGSLVMAIVCVVVSVNLSFYWGLRPHVFTFAMFALLIAWLDWCFADWAGHWNLPWPTSKGNRTARLKRGRLKHLWLCVLLLLIWTNTHGGFLAGLAVFVAYLACRAIEYGLTGSQDRGRVVGQLIAWATAGVVITLVNPYGPDLHRWLFQSLSVPRPEIQEWHAPVFFGEGSLKLWVLLFMTGFGLIASRRPRDFTQLFVFGLVLTQALQHQRHLPFVTLLFGFWLPVHLQSACTRIRLRPQEAPGFAPLPPPLRFALCLVLMAVSALYAFRVGQRLHGVEVERNRFPVSAFQFMADQGITGRLVVSGEWAQYALSVLGARTPEDAGIEVAFDGRFRTCYPQQAVDRHFDFFVGKGDPDQRYRSPESLPADPKRVLVAHQPELVLLCRRQQHAVDVMQQVRDQWSLLYQDELAQLWGRAALYDDPHSRSFLPLAHRNVGSAPQVGSVPWPAAPVARHETRLVIDD